MIKRDPLIDVLRGIAIFLVVMAHSWFLNFPGDLFIDQFHMALFMAISGYLFKIERVDSVEKLKLYFIKKVKTLYLPYVLANSFFILLNNFFVKIHFLCTDAKLMDSFQPGIGPDAILSPVETLKQIGLCALFIGYSPRFGGATWFLRCLFMLSIVYGAVSYLLIKFKKSQNIQLIIGFVMLFVWAFNASRNFILIGSVVQLLLYYYAFAIGQLVFRKSFLSRVSVINWLAIIAVSGVIVYLNMTYGGLIDKYLPFMPIEVVTVIRTVVNCICGWCMMYGLANILARFKISRLFILFGESTLEIMLLHFLAFKFVTAFIVGVRHLPYYYMAATPTLAKTGPVFGIMYWMLAMVLPTIIHFLIYRKKYVHE